MADRTITQRSLRYRRKLTRERGMRRVEVIVPSALADDVRRFARSLHARSVDARRRVDVNAEEINDRAKLIYGRLIARRLRAQPELLDAAEKVVDEWLRHTAEADAREWRAILEQGLDATLAILTGRGPRERQLRLSAPFFVMPEFAMTDTETRRKLWRHARRGFARSQTSTARSNP